MRGGSGSTGGGASSGGTSSGSSSSGGGGTSGAGSVDSVGRLSAGIFDIFDSGSFHMELLATVNEVSMDVEMYIKDGAIAIAMLSEGDSMRMITKEGKTTIIIDSQKMAIVTSAEDDESPMSYIGSRPGLVYIGEGSGDFKGKTYKYDEYKDENSVNIFYFVDGGDLKGMRIINGGETVDMEVVVFDNKVPDSKFEVPEDYQVMEY
jgi:hypothetical protein